MGKNTGHKKPKVLTRFKTAEDLFGVEDGPVATKEDWQLASNDFKKESDLSDFIAINMSLFCEQVLGDKLISFEVDSPVCKKACFGPRGRRIDFLIVCEKHTYIVELKNPTSNTENRHAIGQLLDYGREYLDPKKRLVLITTKYDISTARTIRHYDLPIRYIYFDKSRTMELIDD